jgi:DHA1 family bicyclomycin/chloramphenicol resistance-like MFS transporter
MQLFLFVLASGAQLTYPVLTLEMIDMHPLARGAAASVQTFVALGVGALAMGMLAPILHGNLALMAWIALACSVLAWLLWRAGSALKR